VALYLIGDIQGCYSELIALLDQVNFNKNIDQLYLAGDIVARGPDSLATLRFVKSLDNCVKIVLGNHDLHLLSVYSGIKKVKKSDKLTSLLAADDVHDLMVWLGNQPLLQVIPGIKDQHDIEIEPPAYMTHAGICPQWTLDIAVKQARLIQNKLQSSERNEWLALMYGESPNNWEQAHTEVEKFRFSINALTRMRFCFLDGSLEFDQKDAPKKLEEKEYSKGKPIQPWYTLTKEIDTHKWVFGHWASLMGECSHDNIYPLDTGCVWGNHLTMLRWHDKQIIFSLNNLNI
jgi:bis(5'-nucleosyl)-tetraphosphatase (symmetrical)